MPNLPKYVPLLALTSALTVGCASNNAQSEVQTKPEVATVVVEKVPKDTRKNVKGCLQPNKASDEIESVFMPIFEKYLDMPHSDILQRFETQEELRASIQTEVLAATKRLSLSDKCLDEYEEVISRAAVWFYTAE